MLSNLDSNAGLGNQPIWANDVAACVASALGHDGTGRFELAGPETLSYDEISDLVSRASGRPRPLPPGG